MKVGFIGLGIMGRPMALNLLKGGFDLTVWARRAESMAPLLEAGAKGAASAAAVAASCDVVFSMVADAADVEQVALAAGGVAEGARAGLVYVDMSTIAPSAAQSIAARLAERGVVMLDAPVSGGEVGAISGALTIMVGGDEAAFETVRPLFACMGKAATLIGASGAGQVAKACNQILTGVGVLAVAEAFNFARKSGVDAGKVREARVSLAGNYSVLPVGEQTYTGGTGTGMTMALLYTALTITVSGGGTNYPQYPPPVARYSGGTVFRPPVLVVTMTPTQTTLKLNNGKVNITGYPTSAAGLDPGDVWVDTGAGNVMKVA